MEGNSLDDFMRNVSTEVDQKVTGACSPYSKKKEDRRPKKCPYDYIKAMNISKTSGWFGTDRLYLGYKWTGYLKMMFAFVALAFAIPDLLRKSKTMSSKIPYGPYLVLGCVLYIFLLEQIIKFINL